MTVHGIPGYLSDFLNLQQHVQSRFSCRWVNFSTPGLDGNEERRGNIHWHTMLQLKWLIIIILKLRWHSNVIFKIFLKGKYQGYLEDTALLMKDFLDEIKIDKVVLILHSAGGMFGKNFMHYYPERIKGVV